MSDHALAEEPSAASSARNHTTQPKLTGRMGTSELMLTVLAFSAPLAVVSGFIPYTIMFGGEAATLIFVITTVLLLFFAVGYVTMTKHLPKPGSFYAFISAGLGKVTGLGAAFLATISYLLLLAGSYAMIGLAVTDLVKSMNGPATPWWLWSALAWIVVSVVGHFNIEVSAKVLTVAMIIEVGIVMIFNVAALARGGGPEGYSLTPINPAALSQGDLAVTLLFAIMVFLGFEATALFRDEVRNPDRTIPRATYGAVVFVGGLYTLSCYLLTTAYGSSAVEAATNAPKTMFPDAIGQFVLPVFTQITLIFVATSCLAAQISIHNVVARYFYNLGSDRALPDYLAQIHPRHKSPARASAVVAVVTALVLLLVGMANPAGMGLDAQLFGLGTVGVLVLMALVSLAVVVWFSTKGLPTNGRGNWFKCFVAPGISIVSIVFIVIVAVQHFDLVVGGLPGQNLGLLLVLAASMVIGTAVALYFRSTKPQIYASLGRADTGDTGDTEPARQITD